MTKVGSRTTARDQLVLSALQLMLERGYDGTTVDEICDHAGASKGSFYHFFGSKEELGLAALESFYETGSRRFLGGPFNQEKDPTARLLGFLRQTEARSAEFWGQGCLLGTFAVDLAASRPLVRQRVAEQFDALTARLAELFRPVVGGRAKDLAAGYLAAIEGGVVLARAFNDPSRIRATLKTFRLQLEPSLA